MNARERLSRLASLRGKGGAEQSIKDATPVWSDLLEEEPGALPSSFADSKGKLDSEKALTYYGGFIAAKFGIPVATIMEFASTIRSNYNEVEPFLLVDTGDEFKQAIIALEAQLSAEAAEATRIASVTGATAKKSAEKALSAVSSITLGQVVGPDAKFILGQVIAHAQMLINYESQPVVVKQVASVA